MIAFERETAADEAEIEALQRRVFGPGRYTLTAYRLREGTPPLGKLGFLAREDGVLVGSVRFSPVDVEGARCLLLGPLCVTAEKRRNGTGHKLMERAIEEAVALGETRVILVGDLPFYERVGFSRVPEGRLVFPGPVDPARILWRALAGAAFDGISGLVRPFR